MIGTGVCKRTLTVISFVGDGNDAGANANATASVVRCITFRGNVSGPSTEKALYLLVPLLLSMLLGVIGSFPCYEVRDSPGSSSAKKSKPYMDIYGYTWSKFFTRQVLSHTYPSI